MSMWKKTTGNADITNISKGYGVFRGIFGKGGFKTIEFGEQRRGRIEILLALKSHVFRSARQGTNSLKRHVNQRSRMYG